MIPKPLKAGHRTTLLLHCECVPFSPNQPPALYSKKETEKRDVILKLFHASHDLLTCFRREPQHVVAVPARILWKHTETLIFPSARLPHRHTYKWENIGGPSRQISQTSTCCFLTSSRLTKAVKKENKIQINLRFYTCKQRSQMQNTDDL